MKTRKSRGHISTAIKATATLGPGWALTRSKFVLTQRLRMLQHRTPVCCWSDLALKDVLKPGIPTEPNDFCVWRRGRQLPSFFNSLSSLSAQTFIGQGASLAADKVLQGELPFFGYVQPLGFPPAWQSNPLNHANFPDGHWTAINEFASGDIKLAWEASRFGWVYVLSRAYARARHEPYADAFWTLFESWLYANQPNRGINWKCGQEVSFRVMALCFGLYTFADSPSSTPERILHFVIAIAAHARRIDAFIEYAISQKNNHGLSEGVGLWTIGLLFPELKNSEHWKRRGQQVIEAEIRRQIYNDGSYVQHSANYHRVMMHDLAWAARLGELNNSRLSPLVYERLGRSVRFLHSITDPVSGWAPNYGANDGALVLPLTDCEFPDMRPVLQSCHYLVENSPLYPPGPWDEEMVWLNGLGSLNPAVRSNRGTLSDLNAKDGGCYTIHSASSWAMLRASHYKDRPSQADQLHVDLWWRGENVLCDPGTYSYNTPPPFDHGYASTRYHNTVSVGGADQMTRLGRFLWADWADARVQRRELPGGIKSLEAVHNGFRKTGVTHRRTLVLVNSDAWLVIDDLFGNTSINFRLHWLAQDVPFDLLDPGILDLSFGFGKVRMVLKATAHPRLDVVRAGQRLAGDPCYSPDGSRGWLSRYYARKTPALSIALECDTALSLRFVTVVMLGSTLPVELNASLTNLMIGPRNVLLADIGISTVIHSVI